MGQDRAGVSGRETQGMLIAVICTGKEVLTAKIVNSNFSYMAQKLEYVWLSVH